jgi:hypothetical protein
LQATVIEWDGKHLPKELRELPPGQYLLTVVDDVTDLSPEEEAGICKALDSIEAGHVRPLDDVIHEIRTRTHKR